MEELSELSTCFLIVKWYMKLINFLDEKKTLSAKLKTTINFEKNLVQFFRKTERNLSRSIEYKSAIREWMIEGCLFIDEWIFDLLDAKWFILFDFLLNGLKHTKDFLFRYFIPNLKLGVVIFKIKLDELCLEFIDDFSSKFRFFYSLSFGH